MKSASTATRENELYDIYFSTNSQPVFYVQYYDEDSSTWKNFDDVKSLGLTKAITSSLPGRFNLTPPSNTMKISMVNEDKKYSPSGSGDFADVLKRGLKLRASIGYNLITATEKDYDFDTDDASREYHTTVSSDKIYNSISTTDSYVELPNVSEDWNFYGSGTYGDETYEAEGYFLSEVIDFNVYFVETIKKLELTASGTGMHIYYRTSNNYEDLSDNTKDFTLLGETSSGSNSFTIPNITDRWLQFCIVYATGTWGTGYVEDIQIVYDDTSEMFSQGVYLLTSASFQSTNKNKSVSISAQDDMKKALDTEISTGDYTTTDVGEIIRDIASRAGIDTNDGTTEYCADTGYTVSIDGYTDTKAIDAFSEALQYLVSKDVNYRLYINDSGYLQLENVDIDNTNFDIAFNQTEVLTSISKSMSSGNLVQRVSVYSTDENTDKSVQEVLASGTWTSLGAQTATWSGDASKKDLNYTINTSNTTLTIDDFENEEIDVTIGGTNASPNVSYTVYGNKFSGGYAGYVGEAVNQDNYDENIGKKIEIINRYVQSNAEAKTLAEKILDRYPASPDETDFEITVNNIWTHPQIELGDRIIILEDNTLTFNVYSVENISINCNADKARNTMNLKLLDTGGVLDDIVWDRNGYTVGSDDLFFDTGIAWDMDIWTSESDTNTYNKPITFS